jgi:Uma2 family endonuclease
MIDQPVLTRMTVDEFLALPETMLRRELIYGELVEAMAAPELDHQDVIGSIFVLLKLREKTHKGKAYIAPVDVRLADDVIVQPDALWVAEGGACQPEGRKRLVGAPDLIVEVLSPSTAYEDRKRKFALYESFGVCEYWLVDPRDQLIEVWQLKDERFVRLGIYGPHDSFTSALVGGVEGGAVFEG